MRNGVENSTGESRYLKMMKVYDYWMYLYIRNKTVEQYFRQNHIKKIAIYGMNYLGNRLYDALYGSSVAVVFGIDREADGIEYEIPMYKMDNPDLEEHLKYVDAVVVTAFASYQEILKDLRKIYDKSILCIEDIFLQMMELH